jgi:hypothetical protein
VPGGTKVLGGVPVGGAVTAADVAAGSAEAQVNPSAADPQTFFAPERARYYVSDVIQMRTDFSHVCRSDLIIISERHPAAIAPTADWLGLFLGAPPGCGLTSSPNEERDT